MAARSATTRLSRLPILPRKKKAEGEPLPLVYNRRVRAVAGNGGDGMVAFLRGYRRPFGGPAGGDGGNGGHVIFRASTRVGDLSHVRPELRAERGEFGRSKSQHGAAGDHVEIEVPVGTIIRCPLTSAVLGKLANKGEIFLAARGGAGGHGNEFYVSNEMRKPFKAEIGGRGEEHILDVEMEIMATAAFVGFPNAGKSSLLRAISRARPKVASYPFTTLAPHVGIVHYEDEEQISVADIPGLIEGAHANIGLGHAFLGHLRKCSLLLYVLDASLGDCRHQRDALTRELELFSTELAAKPSSIVLNKADIVPPSEMDRARDEFSDEPGTIVLPLSAKAGTGLVDFLVHLRDKKEGLEERAPDSNS